MNVYRLLIAIILFFPLVNAQYWFQSGARGGQATQFNSGASVTIQTVTSQQLFSGSIAYWVGEDLQNGAFLQTGYVIENQSGRYPSYCDANGCSSYEYLSAGAPEWFYEYFPPNDNNNFLGGIGPNDSAGKNGTFNTYGFFANGTTWNFVMDGNVLGHVNLFTNTSGYNDVVAFGELANTSNGNTNLTDVKFYNVSIYRFGKFVPSPTGFSYIGYGVGSLNNIPNNYGVEEIGSRANAFEIGSGLPKPRNDEPLWTSSYSLTVLSPYANISSSGEYIASRTVGINVPSVFYMGNYTRAIFTGWKGNGPGSYTGQSNSTLVLMYSNITEAAQWQLQYYVNVTSAHGTVHGAGWYPANSTASYSLNQNVIYQNKSSRYVFSGWLNGTTQKNGSVLVNGPIKLDAIWTTEYYVNASAQYGNTTGSGWYPAGSTAYLTVLSPYKNESSTERLAFYSWSDGSTNSPDSIVVDQPYDLYASFRNQFLVNLNGEDEYGTAVNAQQFYINGTSPGTQVYLFGGKSYLVKGALYKGTNVTVNQQIFTNSSRNISVSLPLYDIKVSASDVFGNPVQIPVLITLANGTTSTALTNTNGTSSFTITEDVPYGKALASTQYLGLQLSSSVQYGEQVKFVVLSIGNLEIFAGVLVLAFIIYFIASRHVLTGPNQYEKIQESKKAARRHNQ